MLSESGHCIATRSGHVLAKSGPCSTDKRRVQLGATMKAACRQERQPTTSHPHQADRMLQNRLRPLWLHIGRQGGPAGTKRHQVQASVHPAWSRCEAVRAEPLGAKPCLMAESQGGACCICPAAIDTPAASSGATSTLWPVLPTSGCSAPTTVVCPLPAVHTLYNAANSTDMEVEVTLTPALNSEQFFRWVGLHRSLSISQGWLSAM